MSETLTVASRFCGPPGIGNGGYCSGLLARTIAGPARVTLRKPVPLDRELRVERLASGAARLFDGNTLLADAEPGTVELAVPPPPSMTEARAARAEYLRWEPHPSPTCFVCSPLRDTDGMRIYAGPVRGGTLVAAPWTPAEHMAGDDDTVRPEFLWAALDCPGYWAAMLGETPRMALLGQFAVRIDAAVRVGEPCLIVGWPLIRSGRKHRVGTALFTSEGELRGVALATWIEPAT